MMQDKKKHAKLLSFSSCGDTRLQSDTDEQHPSEPRGTRLDVPWPCLFKKQDVL
jgi:hypothetical protein